MSDKKVGIFSTFLLLGIAAIFFPATALQNSIAMAQEYYNEENEYYEKGYDQYKNDDNNKNAPIVNLEKNLFVCNDINGIPDNITDFLRIGCTNPANFFYPAGPDSGEYIPCNDEICPFIDESDFGAQIFKEVATVPELSPEGTPVNLDKFHYTVTEGEIDDRITIDECSAVGFDDSNFFFTLLEDGAEVGVDICINYVGDCEGTIYPGEVKTCTIENYITAVTFFPPPSEDDNAADNAQSSSLSQQSNNPAMQSQLNILKDIISHRTE
jgi:hypothetical protein